MSGRMMRSDVDLEHWLSRGVAAIDEWQGSFSPFEQHPSLRVSDEQFASAFAALTERLGDNYPFFHPPYAGQMLKPPHPAAVVGYLDGDADQPEQPRPRRRPGHRRGWRRRSWRSWPGCSAWARTWATSPPAARSPTWRPSTSPVNCIRAAASPTARRRTTPTAGCAECSASRAPRSPPTRRAGWTWPRSMTCSRRAGSGRWWQPPAPPAWARSIPCTRCCAVARRHGVRVHVDAAYGGFFTLLAGGRPGRAGPGAVAGDRRVRLRRGRPAQARPAALRLRCGAVRATRRSGASTCTTRPTPTSPPTSCTWARSAWSAPGPARRRPRCG